MADTQFFADKSFTTASAAGSVAAAATALHEFTNWFHDNGGASGNNGIGIQAIRLAVEHSVNLGTGSLQLVVTEDDGGTVRCIHREPITLSVTTLRMGGDGASGGYKMDVVSASTGRDTIDCMGFKKPCRVYLVCTAISGGTIRVTVAETRNAG